MFTRTGIPILWTSKYLHVSGNVKHVIFHPLDAPCRMCVWWPWAIYKYHCQLLVSFFATNWMWYSTFYHAWNLRYFPKYTTNDWDHIHLTFDWHHHYSNKLSDHHHIFHTITFTQNLLRIICWIHQNSSLICFYLSFNHLSAFSSPFVWKLWWTT